MLSLDLTDIAVSLFRKTARLRQSKGVNLENFSRRHPCVLLKVAGTKANLRSLPGRASAPVQQLLKCSGSQLAWLCTSSDKHDLLLSQPKSSPARGADSHSCSRHTSPVPDKRAEPSHRCSPAAIRHWCSFCCVCCCQTRSLWRQTFTAAKSKQVRHKAIVSGCPWQLWAVPFLAMD